MLDAVNNLRYGEMWGVGTHSQFPIPNSREGPLTFFMNLPKT